MKIAILADTHLSAAKYSKVDASTHLSRFMIRQFESLNWVANYLKAANITTILHAGDVFDSTSIGAYPLLHTKEIFDAFNVYAIKGNHDDSSLLHEQNISLIDLLGIHAISKPTAKIIGNTNYVFIPWGFEIDLSLMDESKKNVLVAHGFLHPEFYHEKGASDVLNEERMSAFDLVIAGHNHTMECFTKTKTTYLSPGSLSNYANHYAEKPYLWILDNETLLLEKVPIEGAIRKHKIQTNTPDDFLSSIDEEAIYQIEVPFSANIDKAILQKSKKKALDIQINYMPADTIMETNINNRQDFWDYVTNNSCYLSRFKEIVKEVSHATI